MARLFLFLICFLWALAGQGQAFFRVDSLPDQGILLLSQGWKWHAGDYPAWARPDFDDSDWESMNPAQPVLAMDQLPREGMGWLRIHLRVAPEFRGKDLPLYLWHLGACEGYLNGKSVFRYGRIGPQGKLEQKSIPFYSAHLAMDRDSIQVLAIRYAYSNSFVGLSRVNFLRIGFVSEKARSDFYRREYIRNIIYSILFGVFLILGILLLMLYFAFRNRVANLYFGVFLVAQSPTFFMAPFSSGIIYGYITLPNVVWFYSFQQGLFFVLITLSALFYLLGTYSYFNHPRRLLFFVSVTLILFVLPAYLFRLVSSYDLVLLGFGCIIPWLMILVVGVLSIRQGKPGARAFTVAHASMLLMFTLYTGSVAFSSHFGEYTFLFFAISFLVLALTVSLLLSQERAETNRQLQKQLIELEALSQKTLSQEQEKQQILSRQNELLEQQVEVRTAELKASQSQLIQKEKLASLGELTAGIAHEIQNPLNFVNNYSEVNMELIEELQEEAEKGDTEEIKALLADLSDNERKIHHHGRRADAIVRGMLEHARATPGEKVPTDLNVLADEYLRLAYQSARSKDADFQCERITDFDPDLGRVEVAHSEIGRVLLNLFNNAFYAVRQRAMLVADQAYTPTVWVSTALLPLLEGEGGGGRRYGGVVIKVRDNGTGMPVDVQAKIFQPFFTTKPTGEGTGLGLSLSYDIVTKGHGGALRVESVPGEGTEFIIELPVKLASD